MFEGQAATDLESVPKSFPRRHIGYGWLVSLDFNCTSKLLVFPR